jgi:Ca2+-binding RTX toxin-like protein
VISAWLSLDLANYAYVEHAKVTGLQNLDLTGNNGANSLTGNAGNNLILGLGGNDTIYALSGNDKVFGGGGNDMLVGGAGNDTLLGGIGQDTLLGGVGKDRLFGGGGADLFIFQTKAEVGKGVNRDVISDFTHGIDKIDLSAIDANELQANKQALTFIGGAAFSHTAGELRYGPATGLLAGDTNGDGIADFQLQLIGAPTITAADLVL